MKKTTMAFLMVMGLLTITGFVLATSQTGQRTHGFTAQRPFRGQVQNRDLVRPRTGRLLKVLEAKQEELNITDEQIGKIKDLTLQLEEKRVAHQNTQNTQRLEQKKLMLDKDNLDYDRLRTLLLKNSETRVEHMIEGMKIREQIDAVLSPEQKEALKEMGRGRLGQRRGFMRSRVARHAPGMRRFRRAPQHSRY